MSIGYGLVMFYVSLIKAVIKLYEQCNICYESVIDLVLELGYHFLGWVVEYKE